MIELNPNTLYTRSDLAQMLEPAGVDVDTFLNRLGARKVFKQLWYGLDLLKAIETAPELQERAGGKAGRFRASVESVPIKRSKRSAHSKGNPLDELMRQTKQQSS